MGNELKDRLVSDLDKLGMPVDEVELSIRPYSKTYFGRYYPSCQGKKARVFIYPYVTKEMKIMFPYDTVIFHSIHEMVHHIQYTDPEYVRKKGIMHDPEFYEILDRYVNKAKSIGIIRRLNV